MKEGMKELRDIEVPDSYKAEWGGKLLLPWGKAL